MEAASGMGGIIKSILVLEHGIIPPVADLIEVNPSIDYKYHRLKVNILIQSTLAFDDSLIAI